MKIPGRVSLGSLKASMLFASQLPVLLLLACRGMVCGPPRVSRDLPARRPKIKKQKSKKAYPTATQWHAGIKRMKEPYPLYSARFQSPLPSSPVFIGRRSPAASPTAKKKGPQPQKASTTTTTY
ncbi:hypothetical protein HDK90DRAFT_493170 [Phyllosticta capitalensis]|uniref:Uncharacterized protein n=1 Tax=Phyllosticta capitalensis TaxID=121624 RepID=A0ABR1YH85_9PEZI